jgi:CRP-like cAMP-binding protein
VTAAATHSDPLALMQADREQLTHLLRSIAARLDQLDRQLTDLAWRGRGPGIGAALGEMICARTALESERERLTDRLTVLAGQLNTLDSRISDGDYRDKTASTRVGTCPYCGYPSLGSGLCAFCRPHLAR